MYGVLVAHELQLICEGLTSLVSCWPNFTVVDTVGTQRSLEKALKRETPDILLLDTSFAGSSFETCAKIKSQHPSCKIVLLALAPGLYPGTLLQKSGVEEVVTFEESSEFLKMLLERVVRKQKPEKLPEVAREAQKVAPRNDISELTPKEREVMRLLIEDANTRHVATALHIKPATVSTHKKHILRKLGLKSTAELVVFTFKNLHYL